MEEKRAAWCHLALMFGLEIGTVEWQVRGSLTHKRQRMEQTRRPARLDRGRPRRNRAFWNLGGGYIVRCGPGSGAHGGRASHAGLGLGVGVV